MYFLTLCLCQLQEVKIKLKKINRLHGYIFMKKEITLHV